MNLYFIDVLDNKSQKDRFYMEFSDDIDERDIINIISTNKYLLDNKYKILFFDSYSELLSKRVKKFPNFKDKLLEPN